MYNEGARSAYFAEGKHRHATKSHIMHLCISCQRHIMFAAQTYHQPAPTKSLARTVEAGLFRVILNKLS